MLKFSNPRILVFDIKTKSIIFIIELQFLTWTFSLMYDPIDDFNRVINKLIPEFYKKIMFKVQKTVLYLKTVNELLSSTLKMLKFDNLKSKFISQDTWFLDYYTVPYKIKENKLSFFNFNYMWSNIWNSASFFSSSFSKLRYAWLYLKGSRSNFFSSFYYTGAAIKFIQPDNVSDLNSDHNPYLVKIAPKKKQHLPYKIHPYVSYAASPYCYVAASCSSGSLGFKKKSRRLKDVFNHIKAYFNVFFIYYFSFYKIDFLFFRLNGVYKMLQIFKSQIFKQFKDNFYNLKKIYKKSLELKQVIDTYDDNRDAYPRLLNNLVILMSGHDISKPIPEDKETTAYLAKSMSESDNKFDLKKAKLRRMTMKILYYISKFPKFIYILDATTYPFNGCRRVRHYKK